MAAPAAITPDPVFSTELRRSLQPLLSSLPEGTVPAGVHLILTYGMGLVEQWVHRKFAAELALLKEELAQTSTQIF